MGTTYVLPCLQCTPTWRWGLTALTRTLHLSQVLGRDETWTGNDGQALAAVLGRLRREPRDRVIVYVEGDLGLFVDAADDLVDKYLGFGDGNAWVFPADCT